MRRANRLMRQFSIVARTLSWSALLAVIAVPPSDALGAAQWHVPYPFATNLNSPAIARTLRGPVPVFKALGPMGSYARFSGLRWRGWGERRVTIRGAGRYCDDGCGRVRRVRLVLGGREAECGAGTMTYSRYRIVGLPPYPSSWRRSGIATC